MGEAITKREDKRVRVGGDEVSDICTDVWEWLTTKKTGELASGQE